MKKQVLKIVASIGFLFVLSTISAFAQTPVTAEVPFDFNVGGKKLQAGEYIIKRNIAQSTVVVRNTDGKTTAIAMSQNGRLTGDSAKTKLVFRRYGSENFLAEVIVQGSLTGFELPVSKAERNVIKEMRSRYISLNDVKPEIVVITVGD